MSVGMHACDSASEGESESVRERREGEREREREPALLRLLSLVVSVCFSAFPGHGVPSQNHRSLNPKARTSPSAYVFLSAPAVCWMLLYIRIQVHVCMRGSAGAGAT